jgi:hypothetical protein
VTGLALIHANENVFLELWHLGFHFQDTWKSRGYTNCAAARTPGDFAYAKAFPGEIGITFPKLADEKREAHRTMQVKSANLFHFCAKTISKRALEPRLRGHSQYSLGKNPFQLGLNFVFGPGDVDRFAAFQRNVWKRRFRSSPFSEALA